MQIEKLANSERDLTFKKAFETAQSMELANEEDFRQLFRDASVPMDDTVNKVGKYGSPGHSNEEPWVVFVVVKHILHQDAGPGRFNVASSTLKVTLLICATGKGMYACAPSFLMCQVISILRQWPYLGT